jgi:ABC-type sulfate/molybdate transport systems ATPase subunit
MTTHDREQATRVGDFQLVIKNGRIENQDLR